MLNVLYVVATFIATVIGALAGIGGGIVLKAMTDIFSPDSVQVISFYTTVVVFTMCLVSIVKQIKSGFKYDLPMLLEISVGSLVGGYIGDSLLTVLLRYFPENKVQLTQSIILFLTLIFLIIYTRAMPQRKHVEKPHWLSSFGLGVFLGAISIFLAIGGGPLNVSLLVICFCFTLRDSAIYSIASIFFSQLSKIYTIVMANDYSRYDLGLVPWLAVIAIIGGYIGTTLSQRLSIKMLAILYNVFMIMLAVLTLFSVGRHL